MRKSFPVVVVMTVLVSLVFRQTLTHMNRRYFIFLGYMVVSPESGIQLGSIAVNVSGPCLRDNDFVKVRDLIPFVECHSQLMLSLFQVVFEEWPVDCARLNRIRARCVMPIFHKTGLITLRMSRDGGQSYPYIGSFYVCKPGGII